MLEKLKARLYFLVAGYFAFWARLVLRRWQPVIILVTGSSGKTTLFHLLEVRPSTKFEVDDGSDSNSQKLELEIERNRIFVFLIKRFGSSCTR